MFVFVSFCDLVDSSTKERSQSGRQRSSRCRLKMLDAVLESGLSGKNLSRHLTCCPESHNRRTFRTKHSFIDTQKHPGSLHFANLQDTTRANEFPKTFWKETRPSLPDKLFSGQVRTIRATVSTTHSQGSCDLHTDCSASFDPFSQPHQ